MRMPRSSSSPRSRLGPRPRGFTLVEMVIVIGIVVMLAGLTVAVGSALRRRSETSATENTLLLLDAAMQEWSTISERQLSFGTAGVPVGSTYEIDETLYGPGKAQEASALSRVLERLLKNPASSKLLTQISPKNLIHAPAPSPDSYILDNWDQRIQPVFPGRLWTNADPPALRDADGTIRTAQENIYGICTRRRICFVSTGPDGKRGDLQLGTPAANAASRDQVLVKQAADNLLSYPLLMENP